MILMRGQQPPRARVFVTFANTVLSHPQMSARGEPSKWRLKECPLLGSAKTDTKVYNGRKADLARMTEMGRKQTLRGSGSLPL